MEDARDRSNRAGRLLEGRVALVTGASRGIGAATARLLAANGAAVGVNYHQNAEAAGRVVEAIEGQSGAALAVRADVRDKQQVEHMVREVEEAFGPVDTLILNAAAASTFAFGPLIEQEWPQVTGIVEDQLRASFEPCKALIPSMVERGQGCVVAVGAAGTPEGLATIGIAKAGVAAMMKSLALEMGPRGIRVNVVAPGLVLTEINRWMPQEEKDAVAAHTPLRRNASPDDVAGAILLLASGHSGFVTGACLPVSGGAHMT
jgi:3-oxoacyl-[acyl-carrier protein] reductase